MFKSSRWRSEKNKIKCVFKLQFHATQVPQLGVDALMVLVVPVDVGKPTSRLDKVTAQGGICRWPNPVYETIKFVQDPKTGKINERPYRFILSNGSSKGGSVGEVSVDFADYAEESKATIVSLPLENSKANIIFHVSIQRVQDCEDTKSIPEDKSLKTQLSRGDSDEIVKSGSNEEESLSKTTHIVGLNGDHRTSSGSETTISSSESSSWLNTPREFGRRNNENHQNPITILSPINHTSMPQNAAVHASTKFFEQNQRSQCEWSVGSDLGMSTDESTNGSQDNIPLEITHEAADTEIEKLKSKLVTLARQVDMSDLELQTLRKQIVKENRKGQDLSREVTVLKEERDALKEECDKFKSFQKRIEEAKSKHKVHFDCMDPWVLLDEIREELYYEKDQNVNLHVRLQKTEESNSELILAVQDLEAILEQSKTERECVDNTSGSCKNAEELSVAILRSETDDDKDQTALEELVRGHRDAKETYLLEQTVMDLQSKILMYSRDKDDLEMQMEQLALDYEILKQQNHDMSYKLEQSELRERLKLQCECDSTCANVTEVEVQIENLETELKNMSNKYSDSLDTINELESHIKSLEEDIEKQTQGFEADLEALADAKVEQEQRAIRAEEALREARWKSANTAERLQDEFKKLSIQMASTFEANEKVAVKALTEASELRLQKSMLEEMLRKANEKLQLVRDDYEEKLCDAYKQLDLRSDQIEQMMLEADVLSKELEHQREHEEDVGTGFSQEILELKSETEKLVNMNTLLSDKAEETENLRAELKQLKESIENAEMLIQRGNIERNELLCRITTLKRGAEDTLKELNEIKTIKAETDKEVVILQSEVDTYKSHCDDLKHVLMEEEREKQSLRKQIFQLKDDVRKKEDAFSSIEKKLKDSNRRTTASDTPKATARNNKLSPVTNGSKEVANLKERIKLLEGKIKEKEKVLESSSSSFMEKERDLLNKIEELEKAVDDLGQSSADLCCYRLPKVQRASNIIGIGLDDGTAKEVSTREECLNNISCKSTENENVGSSNKSGKVLLSQTEMNTFAVNNKDCNLGELINELASLKETNTAMEIELKEMQERYSEISWKFAEVEGERQQLVMTVRNLKNSRKN